MNEWMNHRIQLELKLDTNSTEHLYNYNSLHLRV